jgi:type I site-specific restriction endonuclease
MPSEESAHAVSAVMQRLKELQVYVDQMVQDIEAIATAQLQRQAGVADAENVTSAWGEFMVGPDSLLKIMKKHFTSEVYLLYRVLQMCAEEP